MACMPGWKVGSGGNVLDMEGAEEMELDFDEEEDDSSFLDDCEPLVEGREE